MRLALSLFACVGLSLLFAASVLLIIGLVVEQPIFFGDVLFVDGGNAGDEVESMCVNKACQAKLRAYKSRMVVETGLSLPPQYSNPFI